MDPDRNFRFPLELFQSDPDVLTELNQPNINAALGPIAEVFVNPRRKHSYRPNSVSHDFKKAVRAQIREWRKKGRHAEADSLKLVTFHMTRHTFASWLIQRGVPPAEIQQYLGHSSDTMTRRYAHLVPATARGNALEILVAPQNGVSVAKEPCPEKQVAVNSWPSTQAEIAQR